MKIIKRINICLIFCFILAGCEQNNQKMDVLEKNSDKKINYSQEEFYKKGIIEKIQTKLNSKNNILEMFNVKEVKISTDDRDGINRLKPLFAIDKKGNYYFVGNSSEIYKISPVGKLIKKYFSIGRGPGEYQRINDICIDGEQNIFILDGGQKKIIKFSEEFKYLDSFNFGENPISKLQISDGGNLLAFIPTALEHPLVEFDKNSGEILKNYGQADFKTKEYGYAFSRAGSMFVSDNKSYYIFPLSYNLHITDSENQTNIVQYPSAHFNEINERIFIRKTTKKYDIIFAMYQLNREVLLLGKLSFGERGIGRADREYNLVSIYGDVIREKISLEESPMIYGQIEPGKLVSIKHVEKKDNIIDTYIRILDFNLD